MPLNYNYLVCLGILALLSCEQTNPSGPAVKDHFFLENQQATMPIFVEGNTASKVFLLFLHGGPGFSGIVDNENSRHVFNQLEQRYAMVYYDQRCAGISQGRCDYNQLSLAQYVDDLDKLVVLLKARYGDDIRLFLMGHSWGGTLGIAYLTTRNQAQFRGWIEIDGGHDVPQIIIETRQMINQVGAEQIRQGRSVSRWQQLITRVNAVNVTNATGDQTLDINKLAGEAVDQLLTDGLIDKELPLTTRQIVFFSPFSLFAFQQNNEQTVTAFKDKLARINLTPDLPKIKIPTLLVWGNQDFIVPPAIARQAFSQYGSSQKELLFFARSGHYPQESEPELFREAVQRFVEQNR
ncbi:alpha/beta fold hydrolase [Spirosoma sordidisoli]|uniref:Alpha/beta hydrolase n=1 Tax=Spirosoma sordidisoli TaxID=2502893 RepID=A0A4Q2UE83_9BACT|nr:alpha/beta hydrolase [Spirosoma sordidisoli]RYC66582.1 alpha/beta hydrolase [Spirosoma sordidisoli]